MSDDTKDPIRLTRLDVRNFKKIRAASMVIQPGLNRITSGGENGQGKSSLVEALLQLFLGAGAVPENPINDETTDEEKKAQVKGWLSNGWTIEVTITPKGRYLYVRGPDGLKGNQGTINRWVSKTALQLGRFWDLSDEERTETLLSLSPQEDLLERLKENAEIHQDLYEKRTPHLSEVGRLRKVLKKKPEGEKPEPVDTSEVVQKLRTLREEQKEREELRAEHNRYRAAVKGLVEKVAGVQDEIAELERKLEEKRAKAKELKQRIASGKGHVKELREKFDSLPDHTEEIAKAEESLESAQEVQEALEPWREWERAKVSIEKEEAAAAELTEAMKEVEAERREILAGADLPVDNLSVDPDGSLLLNGRPLSAASGAERTTLEIQAAIAENPQLRLVVCDEADGVGKTRREEIAEIATRFNLDVILVQIGLDGPGELEILDGVGSNVPEDEEEPEPEPDEEPDEEPEPEPGEDDTEDEEAAFLLGDDDDWEDGDLELPF